jgi:hypothetical protein
MGRSKGVIMSPNSDDYGYTVCEFAAMLRAAIAHEIGVVAVIEHRPNVIDVIINEDRFRVVVERAQTHGR